MGVTPNTSISSRIRAILLLALVLASVTTFLSTVSSGSLYMSRLFDEKVDSLFTSIENELVMFDYALTLVEQDWENELRASLPKLASEFSQKKLLAADLSPGWLKSRARQYGLTDLYLINQDLKVVAASFEPDIGLDMSKFSDQYSDYLKNLLNKGEVGIDRINVSSETGLLKKYAYYSEPDSNLIVNADIGVLDRISQSPDSDPIRILFEDITQRLSGSHQDVIEFDVFNVSRADQWSLFNAGKKLPRELANRLYSDESLRINDGKLTRVFRKAPFARYDDVGFKVFAMVVIDRSSLKDTLISAFALSALGTTVLAIMIWVLTRLMLKKYMTGRIDELMQQMNRVSDGGSHRIDLPGADEISRIGAKMNQMLERIDHEQLQKQLFESLSQVDALTQLANRRKLDEVLQTETSRVSRGFGHLTVVMLDIDWFKDFNDLYGHLAGDKALQSIASILSHSIQRPSDLVARFGGEEFICLIPGPGRDAGKAHAESIIEHINQARIPCEASKLGTLTVSGGCLFIESRQRCEPESVINQVDQLLYRSKSRGRNCLSFGDFLSSAET
jgi:diguanylate cyclase (GGDEF)-like protein